MSWLIECANKNCKQTTKAAEVVDLIKNHTNKQGYFLCKCGQFGYIKKDFALQEKGKNWEPFLRGVITLADSKDIYQPFVFMVSYTADGEITDVWFSYYKDLRSAKGKLKLGYGPGGPPVLDKKNFFRLINRMIEIGYISPNDFFKINSSRSIEYET